MKAQASGGSRVFDQYRVSGGSIIEPRLPWQRTDSTEHVPESVGRNSEQHQDKDADTVFAWSHTATMVRQDDALEAAQISQIRIGAGNALTSESAAQNGGSGMPVAGMLAGRGVIEPAGGRSRAGKTGRSLAPGAVRRRHSGAVAGRVRVLVEPVSPVCMVTRARPSPRNTAADCGLGALLRPA